MPNLSDDISHVFGDSLIIERTITEMLNGRTIVKAILTIKLTPSGEDLLDENALCRKEITTSLSEDGQITNPGSGAEPDRIAVVQFFLVPDDTRSLLVLDGINYTWSIKVVLDNDVESTPCKGAFSGSHGTVNSVA